MKRAMNIMKISASRLKKIESQNFSFLAGLTLFNLGIYLFSLDLGLIISGLTLVLISVIINIEKGGR